MTQLCKNTKISPNSALVQILNPPDEQQIPKLFLQYQIISLPTDYPTIVAPYSVPRISVLLVVGAYC